MLQRGFELNKLELEPRRLQPFGGDALTRQEQLVGHFAQRESSGYRWNR